MRTYQVKLREDRSIPFANLLLQKAPTGSKSMEAKYLHLLLLVMLAFH